MADIVDRLKAYAEINEGFGTYTEAQCAYDAIHEIERLREIIDILLKHQAREAFDTKPSDSPTD